ncbi:MAG: inositol monophosphatase family protein [Bacteroidota bacterium]|nr:inositol monophosphatase family protein [Bacteroidota bacterium]
MINIAIEAAREAGAFLFENVGKIKNIERKIGQETNLVTEIDKQSEKLIIKKIHQHFPDQAILGEEGGAQEQKSEYRWIIDPLDGTTNFTHGLPIFCVTIGIEYKNEIVAGVIYDPNREELFTSEKGKGAFLNGKRISVSKTDSLINSLLVTGFPYNVNENPQNVIEHFVNFLPKAQGIRRLGSAALDLAYVACGRFDGYWEVSLQPWDKAAGILLVKEAGGIVTNFANSADDIIYNPNTLATNGAIHTKMLDVIQSITGRS